MNIRQQLCLNLTLNCLVVRVFSVYIYLYMYVHVIRKLYIAHRRWLKSLFKFPALLEYQVQGRLKCC